MESHDVGVQRDGSFFGSVGEWRDVLTMLLVCVELGEIPPQYKLQL